MRQSNFSLISLLALCCWLLASGVAPGKETFQQSYAQGVDLYQKGQYQQALEAFKAAYALKQVPMVLINLAQTHLKLQQPKEALQHCELYLLADPNPQPAVRTRLEGYMTRARSMLPPPPGPPGPPAPLPPAPPAPLPPAPAPTIVRPLASSLPALRLTPTGTIPPPAAPLYRRAWFWSVMGVIVAGGVVTGAVLATRGAPAVPDDIMVLDWALGGRP